MPSIEDFKFKKRTFRSWDNNLLENLTLNKENDETKNYSTKNKLESNQGQIEVKLKPNNAKQWSNLSQIKADSKTELKPEFESNLSRERIVNKCIFENTSFLSLVGLQKKLAVYIYELCKYERSKITMPLSIENAAIHGETTVPSVRKALQRMEQKGIIIRKQSKAGRGGWTRYELNKDVHDEISHYNNLNQSSLSSNINKTEVKLESKIKPELKPSFASSSSSLINKTTTETNNKNELPDEWLNTDIELLDIINFHKGHLIQLFRHGLDLDVVQQSINHYAFDLMENEKAKQIKTDPLSFFMGIMKRSGYYAAPENYESPKDRGRRLFLEQEAAKIKKRAEEERAFMKQYFDYWQQALTTGEKLNLVGKDEMIGRNIVLQIDKLRDYYKENCWPEQYKKILNGDE